MLDLINDIETTGTGPDAGVLSIGAVKFDRESRQVHGEFYERIGLDEAQKYGTTTESTMQWWAKQDPVARMEAFVGNVNSETATARFVEFARSTKPWGNGSVFDVIIMENLFRVHGVKAPWQFWNIRDLRTLVDIAGLSKNEVPFIGRPHHALDDARHETKIFFAAMDAMKKNNNGDMELSITSF